MENTTCWKLFCAVLGILEAAVYSATLFGWPAYVYIFIEEHFYYSLCRFDSRGNASSDIVELACTGFGNCTHENAEDGRVQNCTEQEGMLNLVYTVAFVGLAALSMLGYIFDHCGTVFVRTISICLCAGGFFLMALADLGTEWLLFPGAVFHLLGGVQLAVTDVQVATLFPKLKATLTCLVSGAMGISGFVPILLKLAYQAGVSYKTCMFTFTGIILLMSTANTIILPPRQDDDGNNIDIACCLKIRKMFNSTKESPPSCGKSSTTVDCKAKPDSVDEFESDDEVNEIQIIGEDFATAATTSYNANMRLKTESDLNVATDAWHQHKNKVNSSEPRTDGSANMVPDVENSESKETDKGTYISSLQGSLLVLKKPTFWMSMLWLCCQTTLIVTFQVSTYTDVFSWFQVGALFWALLTGLILDKLIAGATKEGNKHDDAIDRSVSEMVFFV
ncbi:uncharacterized protein LOC106154472 [Lingula anatina]|uniref:Uncharacterized protein LOC106154472 n=1 Tax=Lingula anatina TaxID=7574 RepID=A0A1S3HGY0_LINAN|nr:uncharacterized protein LOC106154472 [Lingula anatina]|eukprot:XP_013384279.1 uncharacterized protein LOC106154472 [Lingula anatina]